MLRYAVRKDLSGLYEKGQKALDNSNVEKAMYEFVFFKLLENSLGIFTLGLLVSKLFLTEQSANFRNQYMSYKELKTGFGFSLSQTVD